MQVLLEAAVEKCWMEGAKAERERIAKRQADADECPPKYDCLIQRIGCQKCWLDWLEADE
jgi:hypothetical protein